jgi:hypothetical protein
MKTVPGVVIRIVKWNGDIEPISIMEEAWFRIKGIPMKYRCKSTAFYVASMVGRPLTLDKNYLRNFSYVRVKIGCQDWSLALALGKSRKPSLNSILPEGSLKEISNQTIKWVILLPTRRMGISKGHQNGKGSIRLTMDLVLHLQGCEIILMLNWEDKGMFLTMLMLQGED